MADVPTWIFRSLLPTELAVASCLALGLRPPPVLQTAVDTRTGVEYRRAVPIEEAHL